jgi:hypothetical protein
MQDARFSLRNTSSSTLPDAASAPRKIIRPAPVSGRIHTAVLNDGQGYLTFWGNAFEYFTVDALALADNRGLYPRALFDMERSHRDVRNLQAVDPACVRFTDAVEIDGCVFTSFALHGESAEAVKAALAKVWVVDASARERARAAQ